MSYTKRNARFTSRISDFQFTTSPSTDLPRCLLRKLPDFWDVVVQGGLSMCQIPLPVISPIKNLDARTKAIALWLWSTDSVYHKIRDCMLSDSPNGALVAQEVDKIAVALAHSCRDTPNRDTDTWRGIDVDQARLESIVTDLRNRPFSMKSFAATSARRDVAMGFGPVLLKFENVPKKYLGDVSTHPEEAEFLIPPWQKVRFLCRTRDAFVFTADS